MTSDLMADYATAGFGGRLEPGPRPALVCIDLARAYVDPASPLYAGVEASLAASLRLVERVRAARMPIVWTRVELQPGVGEGGIFQRKVPALRCFETGNPLADFAEGCVPAPGEWVLTKQYASAFAGTALAAHLTALRIDTLLICGWSTSGCVRATAVDACQHGFVPVVVRQAVGDRHPAPHEANLFDIQGKYGEVLDEEAVVDYLDGLSGGAADRSGAGR